MGGGVYLLSFCKKYGDDDITDELYELLEDKSSVKKIYYNGNLNEIIEAIASSEYIVATRFHAVILGLLCRVKVLPISYSIKTENMLKTLGLWNELYEFGNFCNSTNNILSQCFIDNYSIDKSKNTQFDWLDNYLNN